MNKPKAGSAAVTYVMLVRTHILTHDTTCLQLRFCCVGTDTAERLTPDSIFSMVDVAD